MRILHISTRLILGGSQENTVLSCEGQARLGHDVHLAFGPIYGPEGSLLDRVESFRGPRGEQISTHVLPNLIREVSPFADYRAGSELRALIERLRPDIVHTHSSKAGVLGRLAAWRVRGQSAEQRSMGVVHTIHGPPFMPMEGGLVSRVKVSAKNWMYTAAERRAARACHIIVSVADAMTTEFLRRGIGHAGLYTTVYSGMEIELFRSPADLNESRQTVRQALGFGSDDLVVGTVARLAEHKGHDDLLDALAKMLKEQPNMRLLWVGDGWWRGRLIARAKAMGIAVREVDRAVHSSDAATIDESESRRSQIVLTGLVSPERVAAMMRGMDVLAHPSYREGLPRTVPQALLAGVCPVAYDVAGTGEACIEMKTGRLVPLGDRRALRDAVDWCAKNPQKRQELAEAGRALCLTRFSANHMVQELEKVYARAKALATHSTA